MPEAPPLDPSRIPCGGGTQMAALVEAFGDVLVRHVFFCAAICKGVCMWMTKVLGYSSVLFSECASIFS